MSALLPPTPAAHAPSESERATRASERRYRIAAPNSQRRELRIFGLGATSRGIARAAVDACGAHVRVWEGGSGRDEQGALLPPPGSAAVSDAWLADLADMPAQLSKWLEGANTVVIVAAVGEPLSAVPLIVKLAQPTGVLITGLVVDAAGKSAAATQATVAGLRAHCSMLVVSSDADYVEDMLTALGA